MARLKYNPSSRSKGYNPPQLSREGISNLRNEKNRIIQGLRQNLAAEKEQQQIDRNAMRDNAQLEEDRLKRNRNIEIQNLQNQQDSIAQQAENDRLQAEMDADATQKIFSSLASFSKTIGAVAQKNHEKMIKDQTEEANAKPIEHLIQKVVDRYDDIEFDGEIVGGIVADVNAKEQALESNEPTHITLKNFVGNPALGDVQSRVIENRVLPASFKIISKRALASTDPVFTDSNGAKISGFEASRDPEKMLMVLGQLKQGLFKKMGIDTAAPGRYVDGMTEIEEMTAAYVEAASNASIQNSEKILEQQAKDFDYSNTTKGYTLAFHKRSLISKDAAHAAVAKNIADPTTDFEAINRMDLMGNGKTYCETWPRRCAAAQAQRRAAQVKADKANREFRKAQLLQFEFENVDSIRQAYIENFEQARLQTLQRSYELGLPPSQLMKSIEQSVMSGLEDQEREKLLTQIRFQSIDEAFVNNLEHPENRKAGIAALEEAEKQKYGKTKKETRTGYVGIVKDLLGIDVGANDKNSHRAQMMLDAILKKHAEEFLANAGDFDRTVINIRQAYLDAKAGKSSFLLGEKIPGGQTVYNWEKNLPDNTQFTQRLTQLMATPGATITDYALFVETPEESKATWNSAQGGRAPVFSKGVHFVQRTLNNANPDKKPLTLSEIYNKIQEERGRLSGKPEDYPLLDQHTGTEAVDGLSPANALIYEKAQRFNNYMMGRRVVESHTGRLQSNLRPSMGGSSLQPLRDFAPQVSSVTFDTGQPGIDIFFEDHNFPAVLPGAVKDIGYQINADGSGYGHYLVIESIDPETDEAVDVLYSHLPVKPTQSIGQSIELGEIIGKQGGTGSVQSYDGTIASIDFLAPAPRGSGSMTPYSNYKSLRERIASQFQ